MPAWSNWARTVHATPDRVVAPADLPALRQVVVDAAQAGRRVRVPGSGHSWSGCAAPDQTWVRLDQLPQSVEIVGDTVRVEGPVTLGALVDQLWQAGRMLPNLGTITAQTVVGATATGTHGTGIGLPILSAGVTEMRLVDGHGDPLTLVEGDPRLEAARVHLGALGLVTGLTLRTLPAQRLAERLVNVPLEAALEQLPDRLAAHRHVRLWWLPQAGCVQLYTADLTDDADTGPGSLALRLDRWGLQQPILSALLGLGVRLPALVPLIHRYAQATSFGDRQRVESQPHVLTLPVPPRHHEVEVSLPAADAADGIRELWRLSHAQPSTPDFIQEVRFVQGDAAPLSPAFGRDSVYLGAYCTHPGTAAAFHADLLAFARLYGARPHWGKRFDHTAAQLAPLYPQWSRFQALRAELDPFGVFRSGWHDRVLGWGEATGR